MLPIGPLFGIFMMNWSMLLFLGFIHKIWCSMEQYGPGPYMVSWSIFSIVITDAGMKCRNFTLSHYVININKSFEKNIYILLSIFQEVWVTRARMPSQYMACTFHQDFEGEHMASMGTIRTQVYINRKKDILSLFL